MGSESDASREFFRRNAAQDGAPPSEAGGIRSVVDVADGCPAWRNVYYKIVSAPLRSRSGFGGKEGSLKTDDR
jgi:hypothetical protein